MAGDAAGGVGGVEKGVSQPNRFAHPARPSIGLLAAHLELHLLPWWAGWAPNGWLPCLRRAVYRPPAFLACRGSRFPPESRARDVITAPARILTQHRATYGWRPSQ